jgi:hypothetical protein
MFPPPISVQQIHGIELLTTRATESLMRAIDQIPDNGQGYAYFERGPVRATLSTNPYAGWTVGACGVTLADDETLDATIEFFRTHGVGPVIRVVPDGFNKEQSARLARYGLRQTGFHTTMWSLLPIDGEPIPSNIRVKHVTEADEYDIALDTLHAGWRLPPNPDSPLKRVRRAWRTAVGHRTYLAYLDDQPAGTAMMYVEGTSAYLENASVPPEFRHRGVHSSMIRQRILDAMSLGCETIFGGAGFESTEPQHQIRSGLQTAYLAAIWTAS